MFDHVPTVHDSRYTTNLQTDVTILAHSKSRNILVILAHVAQKSRPEYPQASY